ncbi:hypothetical protein K504DRAFT_392893, partial [Pleomassaria siparia CBS 279.74]
PYKYYYKKRVEIAVQQGCEDFNKVEFLHAIRVIRKDAFKVNIIKLAFKKAEI